MIVTGRVKKPFAIIVAGLPGRGKSTFAQDAPDPIFVTTEECDELDAARFPIAKSYEEFLDNLKSKEVKEHKTVVIDAIDGVEQLMHKYLLDNDPKKSKTAATAYGGYGNFYTEAAKLFEKDIKGTLRDLRDNYGMHVIIISHTHKKTENDPINGISYETVRLNLHEKAQSVLVDWVSAVMFASFVNVQDESDYRGAFAVATGDRVLYTEARPGFSTAKNRYALPFELPLKFDAFYEGYENYFAKKSRSADELIAEIEILLAHIQDDELAIKVRESVQKSKEDSEKLHKIIEKLKIRARGE